MPDETISLDYCRVCGAKTANHEKERIRQISRSIHNNIQFLDTITVENIGIQTTREDLDYQESRKQGVTHW